MSEYERAKRVLVALRLKPGVLFALLCQARDEKVLGRWGVTETVAIRRSPDGSPVGVAQQDGATWSYRVPSAPRGTNRFISRTTAMVAADGALRDDGWLLDTAPPIEIKGPDLTPSAPVAPGVWGLTDWLDEDGSGRHICRREDGSGIPVAWIGRTSGGGFYGQADGRDVLDHPGGSTAHFNTLTEAKTQVDANLREMGYVLP